MTEDRAQTRKRWRPWHMDAVIVLLLFAVAATAGGAYVLTWDGEAQFWQPMFGPAVMWASGRGFVNPRFSQAPALESFLYRRTPSLSPEEVPQDIDILPRDTAGMTYDEVNAFHPHEDFPGWLPWQQAHKYLLMAVAITWRLFGISWRALAPLYALLYGLSAAALYGIFRVAMRRPLSVLCTLILIVSPIQLQQLPHLRDYAKAPFFLALLMVLGHFIRFATTRRRALALAAAAGAILGIGIGFRQDLVIGVPLALVAVSVFLPGHVRATWRLRLAASTVFFAVFFVIGAPVLLRVSAGSNATHHALLGMTVECDERLGMGTPLYDFGAPFNDRYIMSSVVSYSERILQQKVDVYSYSKDLDRAGKALYREYLKRFPADIVFAAYMSVLRLLDEMRVPSEQHVPTGVTVPLLEEAWRLEGWGLEHVVSRVRYATALALLLVAAVSPRMAFGFLFLLLYTAGYPGIRFHLRHCFHLEFMQYFVVGFLLQAGWTYAFRLNPWRRRGEPGERPFRPWHYWSPYGKRMAAFAAISIAGLVLPMVALRVYQYVQLEDYRIALLSANLEELEYTQVDLEEPRNMCRIRPVGFAQMDRVPEEKRGMFAQAEYLVILLVYPPILTVMDLQYDPLDPDWDFSRRYEVQTREGSSFANLFCPVYYSDKAQFMGIDVPKAILPCIKGVYRIRNVEDYPILLPMRVADGFHRLPHYKVMTR